MADDAKSDDKKQDQQDQDQDQVDDATRADHWRAEARRWESRAKANDKKLEEIENERKTDLEKAVARAEKAEKQLADHDREMTRLTIASKHGITGDNLDLLHGTDEESLNANAEKLIKLIGGPKKPVVPAEGKTPKSGAADSEDRQFASTLFRGE